MPNVFRVRQHGDPAAVLSSGGELVPARVARRRPHGWPRSGAGARFCGLVLGVAVVLLGGVAAINVLVDPFAMYRLRPIEGFNLVKPAVYHRVRLFKAFEVRRVRPRTIVLGSSRAHLGFGCAHQAWRTVDGACYNLAFDGATTREMYAYLRHAQAVRPLASVLLALDTYHLGGGPGFTRPDFDPLVLFDPDRPRALGLLTADARLLTSAATLRASLDTVRQQHLGGPAWFAADGQRLGDVFFPEVDATFRRLGPRGYFDEVNAAEVGYQTEGLNPAAATPHVSAPAGPESSSFADIQRIVDFCVTERIALRIVITPAHASQYEIASAVGSWPAMQQGKRRLVGLLADVAAAHPGAPPIPLWDFSGYSSVTTEPPPRDPGREMRFYWDSSHFKSAVGDWVLDRVFGTNSPASPVPGDFGVPLTPRTIDHALADAQSAQAAYQVRHAEDVRQLRSMVARALGRTSPSPHQDRAEQSCGPQD